jgi:bifunctional ADP-heptose synthase (sugar kinase/adenylyltransferase)
MKIIIVSGVYLIQFILVTLAYFKAARKLGDELVVALNSDDWLINKKKVNFLAIWKSEKQL